MPEPEPATAAACTCERLRHGKWHEDRDCPQRLQGSIWGNAVDGYEVAVVDTGSLMEGRVVRRYDGTIRRERKARKVAAKMLADERRREQTDVRERIL